MLATVEDAHGFIGLPVVPPWAASSEDESLTGSDVMPSILSSFSATSSDLAALGFSPGAEHPPDRESWLLLDGPSHDAFGKREAETAEAAPRRMETVKEGLEGDWDLYLELGTLVRFGGTDRSNSKRALSEGDCSGSSPPA